MDLSKLKDPFPAEEIEWRIQSCGTTKGKIWARCLAYVTNRAIQNRLDEVVGPENWKNEFTRGPDGGILCGLSIRCDGEWVTKWDGAENTQVEAVKGGLSSSMKRAASTGWGLGRYLYYLEEGFAIVSEKGKFSGKTKEGTPFKWDPPALPSWALPAKPNKAKAPQQQELVHVNFNKSAQAPAPTPSPAADSPELKEAIQTVNNYIEKGMLNKGWIPTATEYINTKDFDGLKRVIDYMNKEVNKELEETA